MAILQPLIDMASICYAQGIRHVVISPGSRSAALTLAFVRHGGFEMHVCMDERPAGFIALGIAQQIDSPVVLICTSGSAAYNFAPAVSEAFFQQIPLLVLTADRPKEWLHQYEGQTIYQNEIYGRHVKRSFEISADYAHSDAQWAINRITNEAVNAAASRPYGPVHINVPIREPFYPIETEELQPSSQIRVIKRQLADAKLPQEAWEELLEEWEDSPRILIAGGQGKRNDSLNKALATISDEWGIPVLGDCISNLEDDRFIKHHDLFLSTAEAADLCPDLLVTFGLSFLSKEFKQFLRKNTPKKHWHIGQDNFLADPTQSVTRIIPVTPTGFFQDLFEKIDYQLFVQNTDPENDASYGQKWSNAEIKARRTKADYLKNLTYLNDLTVLDYIFKYSNIEFELHAANSMSVRYANVLASDGHFSGVFANRGTSGIDGCVSTAIGAAKVNQKPTLLVVGDVAFLYDRNGLLTESLPQNLKIVVLNNAGGNIFRMIDGPRGLGELEKFFETRHGFSARRTAEDSGIAYLSINEASELESTVSAFFNAPGIALLEAFCDPEDSEHAWKGLKKIFRQ